MDLYKDPFRGEDTSSITNETEARCAGNAHRCLRQPLNMLSKLSPMLARYPQLKALSLKYDDVQHTLRIDTEANNFEIFTQIRVF